jgi:hypothetical protein
MTEALALNLDEGSSDDGHVRDGHDRLRGGLFSASHSNDRDPGQSKPNRKNTRKKWAALPVGRTEARRAGGYVTSVRQSSYLDGFTD